MKIENVESGRIKNKSIHLIEGKHTKQSNFPSLGDIKDGLLKMILFTNLEDVKINNKNYTPIPTLKLTAEKEFELRNLNKSGGKILKLLQKEAEKNKFKIKVNKIL